MDTLMEIIRTVVLIGLSALLILLPIMAMVMEYRKEMMAIELEKRRLGNPEVDKQVEALRAEIALLRETALQYDMSLQANLENLQERVRSLEQQLEAQTRVRG